MGDKKSAFLFVFLMLFFVGILGGVVSAEITGVDITSHSSGDYLTGLEVVTWDLTGTTDAGDRYNLDYSSDGSTWVSINSEPLAAGSTTYSSWNTSKLDGEFQLRVRHFNSGFQNEDVVEGLIIDNTNPDIETDTLTDPNGEEAIAGGSSFEITWESEDITDTNLGDNPIILQYSTDGLDWTTIAEDEENDGSYDWSVPLINSENVSVRIIATDLAGNTASDISDDVFTIDSIKPSISSFEIDHPTISPNGDGFNDSVEIDLEFNESSDYDIEILDSDENVVYDWSGNNVGNPNPKTWEGIYESNDTVVPDGVYTIRVSLEDLAGNTYVDTNETITVDTKTIYSGGDSNYESIGDAINAAKDGDTIMVFAGTYSEGQLNVDKEVTLQSIDGASETIVKITGYGFNIIADNVIIDGFAFTTDAEDAIGLLRIGMSKTNSVHAVDNVTIRNNVFSNFTTEQDTEAHHAISVGTSNPEKLITDITITDNRFTNLETTATGNGSVMSAIILFDDSEGDNALPSDVTISDNVIMDIEAENGFFYSRGISIEGQDITIEGNDVSDISVGIVIHGSSSDIENEGNEIYDASAGIVVDGTDNITISRDEIHNNFYGIQIQPGSTPEIHHNKIYDNTDKGIHNAQEGAVSVNATFNWWGDASGPEHSSNSGGEGDEVTDNVLFEPWAENVDLTRFYRPVLSEIADQTVNEGSTLEINLSATDADGDDLEYEDDVSFGTLEDNVFTWATTGENQGDHSALFTVSDGDLSDSVVVDIEVKNVAPEIDAGNDQTVDEGEEVSFSGSATDAGEDKLTYSWDFGDESGSESSSTGQATHTYSDNGNYTATLTVSDGTTEVQDTLTVTVKNVAPKINSLINNISTDHNSVVVDETIEFTASATDAGDDELTYSWDFGDGNTTSDEDLKSIVHSYDSSGTFTVTLTVTDDDSGSDSTTLGINVHNLLWDLTSDSGWSLVSTPRNLTNSDVEALIGNATIYQYKNGDWLSKENISSIKPGYGYWVDDKGNNSVSGLDYGNECAGPTCFPSGDIDLDLIEQGWNLIGITTTKTEKNVSDVFKSPVIGEWVPGLFYVVSYDESGEGKFEFMNATDTLNPGEGYWVYKTQ